MLYIFDQQKGTLSALGVTLDCVLSLVKQWTLRPHIGVELPTAPPLGPAAEHVPSFGTLDPFRPRASAVIHGTVLSLILFCMTVFAIRYSWSHVLNLHIREIGIVQQVRAQARPSDSAWLQLDPYVGEYISNHPPARISIRIEGDPLAGSRLSLSLAGAGQPSFALAHVSAARFVIVGAGNSYVDFTADGEGRVCRLSFVVNGRAISAERQ